MANNDQLQWVMLYTQHSHTFECGCGISGAKHRFNCKGCGCLQTKVYLHGKVLCLHTTNMYLKRQTRATECPTLKIYSIKKTLIKSV